MKDKLPSGRFRKELRNQLDLLTGEGLISQEQALQLRERYRLDSLGAEAMSHLLSIIYSVGAVLIGIGIISFVAAHWEIIPRPVKAALLFAVMLTAHGAGFWLWKVRGGYPKLGHTLILLGTLIFGANIGLMAQIFHIRGNPFNAFLAWSIGAAIMAYAVCSVPNGIVALVTAGIFYFGMLSEYRSDAPLWFPAAAVIAFAPLVIILRSQWLLWLLLILLAAALPLGMMDADVESVVLAGFALMAFFFMGTAMASRLWEPTAFVVTPARIGAVFAAMVGLYFASFHEIAQDINDVSFHEAASLSPDGWVAAVLFLLAGLGMAALAMSRRKTTTDLLLLACIAAAFVILSVLPFSASFFTLTVLANVVYLLFCVVLFYLSFRCESRGAFWSGAGMLFLLIISRTLEYETELVLKAVIFVTCGIGFIVAGILFERFLKTRREIHA